MDLKSILPFIAFLGGMFCLMLGVEMYENWQNNKFRQSILVSPAFGNGRFLELKAGRGFLTGYYSFTVNYETHGGEKADNRYRKLKTLVYNKTFPVIYNRKEPTINAILVFPDDFSNFNLPYPDSLAWVKALIDE